VLPASPVDTVNAVSEMRQKGLIHVYTGEGKGKTTVALGLALRALGHGFKVHIIEFLKGGKHLGELGLVDELPNLSINQYGRYCPYSEEMKKGNIDCGNCRDCFMTREQEMEKTRKGLKDAGESTSSGEHDLVILDEINVAVDKEMVDLEDVLNMLEEKHPDTEVVLTGRGAHEELINAADYVTVMQEVKHPFTRGVRVRRGIDY